MNGDQLASSFGDPNAQPPTPKQTPTSEIFPSPVFQTPKNHRGSFDDSAGAWTPRFAEEYSVFNSTPGNLRGSQGPFVDFSAPSPFTPYPPSAGQKRPLSAGGLAAEIATHVNHFSPNPNVPLPPVAPAHRLASAPGPVSLTSPEQLVEAEGQINSPPEERSAKKPRRGTTKDLQGQTATPPPSARKGGRKLAPKLQTDTMQNDQGYGQPDFTGTPQQPNMATFVTTPNDMYGYPMSAPATAPPFADSRFWDPDPSMAGMDIDFSATGGDVFQTPTPVHRPMGSMDWARDNQMFQEAGVAAQQNQEALQPTTQERPLAPRQILPNLDTTPADHGVFTANYSTPIDDPFGIVTPGGGVNPGLLFSRPPSSSLDTVAFTPSQQPSSSAPAAPQGLQGSHAAARPTKAELRRSASVKELGPSKHWDRVPPSSPLTTWQRPTLSRSFSENRGKRPVGRPALPKLAPAIKPAAPQLSGNTGVSNNRSASHNNRPSGRTSPSKAHQRLSNLTSIPEASNNPRTRTSVKFTIDANGRARVETTVNVDEDPRPPPSHRKKASSSQNAGRSHWDSSDDDDNSETDDEEIVIPSRTTSFALPDPLKVASGGRGGPSFTHAHAHASQRSVSERSTTSTTAAFPADPESEAETVLNEGGLKGGGAGDAASELEKLRRNRSGGKLVGSGHRQRFASAVSFGDGAGGGGGYGGSANTISPTTLTDTSLPTPTTDSRSLGGQGGGVRCVCNRPERDDGDGFMVQCESCEMWLHGRCINISKRTLPSVYICAFCANTPNMRGGRIRDAGRGGNAMAPAGGSVASQSPLAHKSFKSFR